MKNFMSSTKYLLLLLVGVGGVSPSSRKGINNTKLHTNTAQGLYKPLALLKRGMFI